MEKLLQVSGFRLSFSPSLMVAVKTDQSGKLYVDFSPDKTNLDGTLPVFNYDPTGINPPHRITVTRKWARVRFVNDSGSDQTYFRLQTMMGAQTPLNTPVNGTVAKTADALVTRTVSYNEDTALGRIEGRQAYYKFGLNRGISNTTADIWNQGGTMPALTTAANLYVSSSSTSDTGDIKVVYIDAGGYEQTATVTMGGQSQTLIASGLFVNRAYNDSGTPFIGNVYIAELDATISAGVPQDAAKIHAKISIGDEQTDKCALRVPTNKVALVYGFGAGALRTSAAGAMTVKLLVKELGKTFRKRARELELATAGTSGRNIEFIVPLKFPGDSIIKLTATTTDNSMLVSGDMNIVLVDNT